MHTWFGKSLAFVVEQVLSLHFTNVYPFFNHLAASQCRVLNSNLLVVDLRVKLRLDYSTLR